MVRVVEEARLEDQVQAVRVLEVLLVLEDQARVVQVLALQGAEGTFLPFLKGVARQVRVEVEVVEVAEVALGETGVREGRMELEVVLRRSGMRRSCQASDRRAGHQKIVEVPHILIPAKAVQVVVVEQQQEQLPGTYRQQAEVVAPDNHLHILTNILLAHHPPMPEVQQRQAQV